MKKIYVLMMAICFVIAFSAIDSFAQKSRKKREIQLLKNARKNSYKTVVQNGIIYFEAENVEDPLDGEPLRGEKDLEYRCTADGIPLIKRLLFTNGRSNRQPVDCLILITPRIVIFEEEEEN